MESLTEVMGAMSWLIWALRAQQPYKNIGTRKVNRPRRGTDRRHDDPFRFLNADELQLFEAHDHGDDSLAARIFEVKYMHGPTLRCY